MLAWASSWWSTDTFTGPARNAPNKGRNIKELFDQKPKHVIIVTAKQITDIRKNLKKTVTNAERPKTQKPPVMAELDTVFEQGNINYFEMLRKRREMKKLLQSSINTDESRNEITISEVESNEVTIAKTDSGEINENEINVEVEEFQNM